MIIAREYFSISELSDYSGISKRTLWTLLNNPNDSIPHFRVGSAGRIVRVRRSDFDDWMERQRGDRNIKDIDKIVDEIFANEAAQKE